MKYTYIIMGDPTSLGAVRDDHRKSYDHRQHIKTNFILTLEALHQDKPPLLGPLHLDIHFYLPATQGQKNGNPHNSRPDLTDLIFNVERCATYILFPNPCTITSISSTKRYSTKPRTEFTLIPYEELNGFSYNYR